MAAAPAALIHNDAPMYIGGEDTRPNSARIRLRARSIHVISSACRRSLKEASRERAQFGVAMCAKIMRRSMGTEGSRYRAGRRRQRRARGVCEKRQMRDAACMRFETGCIAAAGGSGGHPNSIRHHGAPQVCSTPLVARCPVSHASCLSCDLRFHQVAVVGAAAHEHETTAVHGIGP